MHRPRDRASGILLIVLGAALGAYGMSVSGGSVSEATTVSGATAAVAAPSRAASIPSPSALMPGSDEGRTRVPVVVTVASRPEETPPARTPSVAPRDRGELVRELQRELRRVGCYEGEINGAWTGSTRRAMSSFIDHVNAVLPVDEPDPVLHAILGGHAGRACGEPCPAEEARGEGSRCVPAAILVKAAPKAPVQPEAVVGGARAADRRAGSAGGWRTTTTAEATIVPRANPAPPRPRVARRVPVPIAGRMALAGPGTELPSATTPAAASPRAAQTGPRPRRGRTAARIQRRAAMAHAVQRRPSSVRPLFPIGWLF